MSQRFGVSSNVCGMLAKCESWPISAVFEEDILLQAYEAESYLVSAQDAHKAAHEHVNLHADVRTFSFESPQTLLASFLRGMLSEKFQAMPDDSHCHRSTDLQYVHRR